MKRNRMRQNAHNSSSGIPIWVVLAGAVVLALLVVATSGSNEQPSRSLPVARRAQQEAPEVDTSRWGEASLVMKRLIETHPDHEVRTELFRRIDLQEGPDRIFLNFQGEVAGSVEAVATALTVRTPDGDLLTLSVNPALLLDPNESTEMKQLVIFHEWIHLKQQSSSDQVRYPRWLGYGYRTGTLTNEMVRIFYEAEMEAYLAECVLATRLGWSERMEICVPYARGGEPALRVYIANRFAAIPQYAPFASIFHVLARRGQLPP